MSKTLDEEWGAEMKLQRIWRGSALSVVLCLGCTAPVPDARLDPVVLEARLAVLDTRLERLEQSVGALWEHQQQRGATHEQGLAGITRALEETRESVAKLRRTVERPTPVIYQVVDVLLGALPSGRDDLSTYPIPTAVPDAAREILVYAQVATGYVEGGPRRFRIATRLADGREAAFYLHAVGGLQRSWAYNSDNVWLPMPKDRTLLLQTVGRPFFGDWNSEVRIIAYR
jgi:hypothetical protein